MIEDTDHDLYCATHGCPLADCPHCRPYLSRVVVKNDGPIPSITCEHNVSTKVLCAECSIT